MSKIALTFFNDILSDTMMFLVIFHDYDFTEIMKTFDLPYLFWDLNMNMERQLKSEVLAEYILSLTGKL